ncbi:N-acetylmuramoyl-L-alanine amidase [Clostridium botulinum]|uniref:N-acetylmuramoyl-L-alanine amidase n=1 Tax=Clostridium botulinum (strain Hall / ATCC 3502 / NCTC 13319 / Type A) TaxID=441771 RepID=A5I495_CLOBH|nr:N-acetylmuramoyl-L-alanine amidase [Clostridium botulinum]NFL68490.1 N-acetylmuramoyl-L-alanine amidase [Clostridium botulinum]NFQ52958.1 N-acetylmuramoyl-L-alanine amidase [Clostridium botulinum]NFT45928.1 N-acetylmuramoyl-L-alanine amidase [Clostridium botulinum]QGT41866.1 N-acetylmuramoyl-L-alanine amidase LytC [Clostridium botulinum]CAL83867.1 putative N-acetylmuramoyl-L-alanine amidase [Clostridium botulinum A str. ATCC 3502]
MKIGIDCGHTLSGADYGAVGIKAESNLTREVGIRVISKLQALGHKVIKCYKDTCNSLNDSLSYRTNTANNNNVDLYVSIHFNCYNGSAYGTEVFTYGGKELQQARAVLNNICALGYTNRGLKDGSSLYVLKHTKSKAMLIECCFCDNAGDMNRYNAENMANAIVKGLVGQTTSSTSNKPTGNSDNGWINLDGKTGAINTPSGINVRAGKSTSSKILGTLANGAKVNLYRKEGDWMHIYYPPCGGYVYAKYIRY